MKRLVAVLLLVAAAPAFADAAASFREGKWPAVVTQGHAENTAASLVMAGRAALAIAAYGTRDKAQALKQVEQAERDFDAALVKAPTNPDIQLQKAIAIGYRAKLTKSPGLGKDARRRFEAIRAANPQNATAWAAVAGWHGGAIATLGNFMASTVLSAKKEEIEPGFAKAFKLDPTNPVHRVIYAQTLLDMDAGNASKAAQGLQGIGQLPAHDGFEALVRSQGVQIAAALKTGDVKAAQRLSRQLQAFGTIG
jgi:hypothetical protein